MFRWPGLVPPALGQRRMPAISMYSYLSPHALYDVVNSLPLYMHVIGFVSHLSKSVQQFACMTVTLPAPSPEDLVSSDVCPPYTVNALTFTASTTSSNSTV